MKKIRYASSDYDPMLLPQNRKALFKDVFKSRFTLILKVGFILLLFTSPILISTLIFDLLKFGTNNMTTEQVQSFQLVSNIILRSCIIIFSYIFLIGLSGILRILKLLIWQEGIDFWYDFKVGVKENYKSMCIPLSIFIILYVCCSAILIFFNPGLITYGSVIILFLIFLPILIWSTYLLNMYNAKIKELLTNSLFFFGKSIPWTLLYCLLIAWPFFYEYFQIPLNLLTVIIKNILFITLLVIYYPTLIIIGLLFSCSYFDKYINEDNYPEFFRKGLFDPNKIKDNIL